MEIVKIMNYLYNVLIRKEKDELIIIRKNELEIVYDILNFILEEFTKKIYILKVCL
jgi:hypothetical protein